jgi:uncharacterized membrane protein SpoIIM required for sporulation
MVFESLITPWKAEKHPWEMFFFGFLYASIAMALSIWIFKDHAGLISVFFTVMSCIPLMYTTLRLEEEKVDYLDEERSILKEHSRALLFFIFLFIGITLAYATWYVVLPAEVSQSIFSVQINTIVDINSRAVGNLDLFTAIFFNNLKVLTFCLLFSFFFGAGAIFILTWNASIIAVAMGSLIKNQVLATTSGPLLAHISGYSTAIIRYFIHGIPEIIAYFVAALAGGIISVAIIKRDIFTRNFQKIAFDTSNLIIISIAILVVAGLLETYVTPFFY